MQARPTECGAERRSRLGERPTNEATCATWTRCGGQSLRASAERGVARATRLLFCCCIRLDMDRASPPPPLHGDYNDTTVTCVGRGCVSIPIVVILLCFICYCSRRNKRARQLQAAQGVQAAQFPGTANSSHYYYAGSAQPACVPVYTMQQSGCVMQGAPTMVMQGPPMVAAQQGMMPAAQPGMMPAAQATMVPIAQPLMRAPVPVVNVAPAAPMVQQGLYPQGQPVAVPVGKPEDEVPMGAPVC